MRKTNTNLSNYDDFLKYSLLHNVISGQEKTPETISFRGLSGEAQTGFEPVDTGVADHCLTTWLLRHTPRVGLEPTTLRLTAECSAIELSRII